MLEYQGDLNPTANAADAPTDSNIRQAYTEIISISDATDSSNTNSILASAFNIMVNHTEAKDAVASSLMEPKQS